MARDVEGMVQGVPGEVRRHMTVLFTDLSDSTRLSGLLEAEVFAALQDDVRRVFDEVVQRSGGTINQYQGDGLQALFGHPEAGEDDGLRATRAALEVHERVRALRARHAYREDMVLDVHSGIHAGLVLVREGTNGIAGRFELFGAAPGIAKHLSDVAERDEILVSEETLGPARYLFQTEARRLALKGRDEPLAVHRILARTALRTRFEAQARRGLVDFVGREAELAALQGALAAARAGHTRLMVVSAPAGVGKTRLAEEFLRDASANGFALWRGYCEAELSAEPLQPFLQMLRARLGTAAAGLAAPALLGGVIAALPAELRERHPELALPGQPADTPAAAAVQAQQLLQVLGRLVGVVAGQAPQLLFIDDWQWADDATRQVVYALAAQPDLPLLVLLATRPLELGDAQLAAADVLALGPLSQAEADTTIRTLLPDADPFVVSSIREHSGGNALFLEELCHLAADTGAGLDALRGGPAWLESLIESRVARLAPQQGAVLGAAAVIGNVVPAWLLQELTGCDAQHPLVTAMAAQDLLFAGEQPGTLRFKHGITRDVVYGTLGLQQRRDMHGRVARLLHARDGATELEQCEPLAYHHAGAADFAAAARYAEIAGDKAMSASSIDRAKTQYRAALEMLDRLPSTPERYQLWRSVVRRLGLATVFDPSRDEKALLRRAVDKARAHGDATGQAYAQYWLAYLHYALGESKDALLHCEEALDHATRLQDMSLIVQARTMLGQAAAAAADYGRAVELLDEMARAVRERRPASRAPLPAIAYAMACRASVLGDLGRFEDAHASFDEALAALPGRGHEVEGSVLCWRAGVNLWQGRWQAALDDAQAAHRVGEQVKSLYLFAMSHGLAAYARWMLDPQPAALEALQESATWLDSHDKGLFASLNHGWVCDAMAAGGRTAEARAAAARVLRRARQRDWLGAAMAGRALAGLAAEAGDADALARHLHLADQAAALRQSPHEAASNHLLRARLALRRDDCGEAQRHLDAATEGFERLRMDWHLAQAAALRASA